jgi:hypothetical protein
MDYNITSYKGDTFNGVQFTVLVNGSAPANDLSSVILTVRPNPTSSTKYQLTSASGITITDATNWVFSIDQQILSWPAANYYYDIQCIDVNGNIKTYIKGRWNVTQDITY